jgi:hypothetical protein
MADAETHQFSPDNNFGSSGTMVSGELDGSAGDEIRRGVLSFDLAGQVPPGAVINSVTLQVTVVKTPSGGINSTFDLRRLLQPWTEGAVTWNSRLAGVQWQVPGATGTSDSAATASSSVFISGLGAYAFPSTAALVNDVQGWVNNPGSNDGWLLISEGEGTPKTARLFATREDTANAPVLNIQYTLSAPPAQPVIAQVSVSSNQFLLSFNAESNRIYAVEYNDSISAGGWLTLTNIPAQQAAAVIPVVDFLTSSNRFYRIRTP